MVEITLSVLLITTVQRDLYLSRPGRGLRGMWVLLSSAVRMFIVLLADMPRAMDALRSDLHSNPAPNASGSVAREPSECLDFPVRNCVDTQVSRISWLPVEDKVFTFAMSFWISECVARELSLICTTSSPCACTQGAFGLCVFVQVRVNGTPLATAS